MFVSSHSKIDISKSKYRDVFLSKLFEQYGLMKQDLFPGNYMHSNFHYSFIIRDKALVSSSRFPIGNGSLAYLGVMYNYNSDEGYCPYEPSDVISTPVKVEALRNIRGVPVTSNPNYSSDAVFIYVPRSFSNLQEANNHLEREFGSNTSDCEGSVIIMQKDPLGLYTNIVRVIHARAENRMRFIEGQNDTEAFLKHIHDLDISNDIFRSKYPLYPITVSTLAKQGEADSFAEYIKMLTRAVGEPYLTSENILSYFRKNRKEYYNINAVPKRVMRLRIIALTFVTCLPPSRQLEGAIAYANYINFLATANDDFNLYRKYIEEQAKPITKKNKFGKTVHQRGPLYTLNEKLKFSVKTLRGAKRNSGKTESKSMEKSPSSRKFNIDFHNLSPDDLTDYYRLHRKLIKLYNRDQEEQA